jgi:histidinol phosphatase-like enzyme (inositol monophosphatase family)
LAELDERLALALTVATEGARIAAGYFQSTSLVIDRKADDSPVTRADVEVEERMRSRLEAACPQDAIIGEELGDRPGTSGYRWYLDPIDGTESFVRGVPLFGTMIGIERDGESVAGVIVFPALGDAVYAARGSGSWWASAVDLTHPERAGQAERRPAKVSTIGDFAHGCFSTTGLDGFTDAGIPAAFDRLIAASATSRGFSDCYGHFLVATGRIDVMVDPLMSVWDNAPLQVIVEEAGGTFTDMLGAAHIHGASAVSTNGLLHDETLSLIGLR